MIQFNLLPDVKLEYIKARRLKRSVMVISSAVAAASFAIFALFFISVSFVQTNHMKNVDEDIQKGKTSLQAIPDLAKILTIQNQLNSLPALHNDKPVASRMFTYVQQLAPQNASISSLTVNFDEQTMTVTGNAVNLAAVNTFVDTLKFTTYGSPDAGADTVPTVAFSEVVLSQFGVAQAGSTPTVSAAKPASYSITLKYAPEIFKADSNVQLTVPNKITTRSETEKPTDIFQPQTTTGEGE